MICPKCGRNIEGGGLCPYCDAPEIDDNIDEYIKKKRAYENSVKCNEEDEAGDENISGGRKISPKTVIIILAVIAGALITALLTTHLPKTYHGQVYAVSNGRVTEIASGDGNNSGKIYSSEGKNVYVYLDEPKIIGDADMQLKAFAASSNGKYFAMTSYEGIESEGTYSLYVWDNYGNITKAASQKAVLSIKDITDGGEIIYTSSSVLNDQWYTGDTSLHIYKITGAEGGELTGEAKKVGEALKSFYIYEDAKCIICLDENGQLFSCSDYNPENRTLLAEKTDALLVEKGDEDNYFSRDSSCVNAANTADLIAYYSDGIWTMSDTQGRISLKLGAAGSEAEFIYDDSDRMVYRNEGNTLSRSVVTDAGLSGWEDVTDKTSENIIWDSGKHTLLCETTDYSVFAVSGMSTNIMASDIERGSLRRVLNSGGYLVLKSDGVYLSEDFKKSPTKAGGEIAGDIHTCAQYKGVVYVYAGDKLYTIDRANNISETGVCEGLYVVG